MTLPIFWGATENPHDCQEKAYRGRPAASRDQRRLGLRQDAEDWAAPEGDPPLVGAAPVANSAGGALRVGGGRPERASREVADGTGPGRGARAVVRPHPPDDG